MNGDITASSNAERGQDDNAHHNLKQAKRVLRKVGISYMGMGGAVHLVAGCR